MAKRYFWDQVYELHHIHWALCDTESTKEGRVSDCYLVLHHHWKKCMDGRLLSEQEMPKRIVDLLNGEHVANLESKQQEVNRLKELIRELMPFLEAAMPEVSTAPFPGPDTQLDCDDMDLAAMCDLYHRAMKAAD